MKTARLFAVASALFATVLGCSLCKRNESSSGQSAAISGSASSTPPPAVSADSPHEDPVHGLWSQRPFSAKSAVASIYPQWITVTLLNREARCDSARLRESDMAVQFTIPSGPTADFYAGHDIPIPLQLNGAGGISAIPAGHVSARLEPFDPQHADVVRGRVGFRFRTANDGDAPTYESQGPFEARVCSNAAAEASMTALPVDEKPVAGRVGKRKVQMRTMLAYLRDDGDGGTIVMLKGYPLNVPCHTKRSATPYLFGAELGKGPRGDHYAGTTMPTTWAVQMRADPYSERSVHAANGGSWLSIDTIDAREGGVVRGRMMAANPDDEDWQFTLSGQFEAVVCGHEATAW